MSVKDFVRKHALWGYKEYMFGPFSVLLCYDTISVNLTISADNGSRKPAWGFTFQPFGINLIGEDGDVCWSSPSFIVIDQLLKNNNRVDSDSK